MGHWMYKITACLLLLLSSCAQVGTISGGATDDTAPRIKEKGMNPPNGSTRFQSKTITIAFDEYIKLNSPTETITLVPSDAKVTATVRKKTLTLNIEGDLKPETTYAIYLNGTVQDITESNDSLIQYVFSTGTFIDTLQYSGFVADAFTYKPVKDVFVGLYAPGNDSTLSKKPLYFGKTDISGKFTLNYIKPGEYKVLAFEDKNRDMLLQKTERVGFKDELVKVDSAFTDSIPLRIFSQSLKSRVRSNVFQGPGLINIGAVGTLDSARFFVDGEEITVNKRFKRDSVSLLVDHGQKSQLQLVVRTADFQDTILMRLGEKERIKSPSYETNLESGGVLLPKQKLRIRFSDKIISFDTSLIQLIYSDTLKLKYGLQQINENTLEVTIDSADIKELKFNILKNSIKFRRGESFVSSTINISQKAERDFGSILLATENLPEYALIEVLLGNNVVYSIKQRNLGKNKLIELLETGSYTFRAILDVNENGKWDDGDLAKRQQPEEILFFTNGLKVRPNWEMEVTLVPEK